MLGHFPKMTQYRGSLCIGDKQRDDIYVRVKECHSSREMLGHNPKVTLIQRFQGTSSEMTYRCESEWMPLESGDAGTLQEDVLARPCDKHWLVHL